VLRPGGAIAIVVPNVESLACRVLHEQARTFDGRNHLAYFSPATLADMLERSGFEPVRIWTEVSSLDAVLEHLGYERPYSDADMSRDPALGRFRAAFEPLVAELDLGYKLHCVARRI